MTDKKPKTVNNDHIHLKVVGQDSSGVHVKIKRQMPLNKLMKVYCEQKLEMEDENTIDVFQHQTGRRRGITDYEDGRTNDSDHIRLCETNVKNLI
ncbi:small ubiquitin-related modifier 2-A-like [Pleurodeles waltl]|uniref:small ubiquitin-related modifier 2-A-like n=1 Tax=Pleurodeles waltl TaxID=8319 RepID=UPI0037098C81